MELYLDSAEWVMMDRLLRNHRKTTLNNREQTKNEGTRQRFIFEATVVDRLLDKLHPNKSAPEQSGKQGDQQL